jgi:hypothetical protein
MGILKREQRKISLRGWMDYLKSGCLCSLFSLIWLLEAVQEPKRDPGNVHEHELTGSPAGGIG